MKQIHIWRNHIRIPEIDLVVVRPQEDTLESALSDLTRLGFDTRPTNIQLHEGDGTA